MTRRATSIRYRLYLPSRLLVGRHEALHTLEGHLSSPGSMVTIKGSAGIGKTALMSHFVAKFADRFESIWWVPATRADLIGWIGRISPSADWSCPCIQCV